MIRYLANKMVGRKKGELELSIKGETGNCWYCIWEFEVGGRLFRESECWNSAFPCVLPFQRQCTSWAAEKLSRLPGRKQEGRFQSWKWQERCCQNFFKNWTLCIMSSKAQEQTDGWQTEQTNKKQHQSKQTRKNSVDIFFWVCIFFMIFKCPQMHSWNLVLSVSDDPGLSR